MGDGYSGGPAGIYNPSSPIYAGGGTSVIDPQAAIKAQQEALKQAQIAQAMAKLNSARQQSLSNIGIERNNITSTLNNAKNSSLSNIDREKAAIAPQYYMQKNTAASQSTMQGKNFAEYLASRGLTRSGTAAQAELNRGTALQGRLGEISNAEQQTNNDLALRRTETENNYNNQLSASLNNLTQRETDAQNAYNSDMLQAVNGIEGNYLQSVIGQNSELMQMAREDAKYKTQREDALSQQSYENKLKEAQANFQIKQAEIDNKFRETQTDIENKLKERQMTNQEAQQALSSALQQREMSLAESKFNYDKTNKAISKFDTNSNFSIDDISRSLDNQFLIKDDYGKLNISDPQTLRARIIALNLPDSVTDQLLLRYGLSTNTVSPTQSLNPYYTPGSASNLSSYSGGR
jgi:hypothetical protein